VGLILVRLTYWLGALVDALAGVQLLLPTTVTVLGFRGLRTPGVAGFPGVTAAVLMFGFSSILVWAQMRPLERRWVLLITLLVVIALAAANIGYGRAGILPWSQLLGALVIQGVLIALFATSYAVAVREEARRGLTTPRAGSVGRGSAC
jgi:hypothetical protein